MRPINSTDSLTGEQEDPLVARLRELEAQLVEATPHSGWLNDAVNTFKSNATSMAEGLMEFSKELGNKTDEVFSHTGEALDAVGFNKAEPVAKFIQQSLDSISTPEKYEAGALLAGKEPSDPFVKEVAGNSPVGAAALNASLYLAKLPGTMITLPYGLTKGVQDEVANAKAQAKAQGTELPDTAVASIVGNTALGLANYPFGYAGLKIGSDDPTKFNLTPSFSLDRAGTQWSEDPLSGVLISAGALKPGKMRLKAMSRALEFLDSKIPGGGEPVTKLRVNLEEQLLRLKTEEYIGKKQAQEKLDRGDDKFATALYGQYPTYSPKAWADAVDLDGVKGRFRAERFPIAEARKEAFNKDRHADLIIEWEKKQAEAEAKAAAEPNLSEPDTRSVSEKLNDLFIQVNEKALEEPVKFNLTPNPVTLDIPTGKGVLQVEVLKTQQSKKAFVDANEIVKSRDNEHPTIPYDQPQEVSSALAPSWMEVEDAYIKIHNALIDSKESGPDSVAEAVQLAKDATLNQRLENETTPYVPPQMDPITGQPIPTIGERFNKLRDTLAKENVEHGEVVAAAFSAISEYNTDHSGILKMLSDYSKSSIDKKGDKASQINYLINRAAYLAERTAKGNLVRIENVNTNSPILWNVEGEVKVNFAREKGVQFLQVEPASKQGIGAPNKFKIRLETLGTGVFDHYQTLKRAGLSEKMATHVAEILHKRQVKEVLRLQENAKYQEMLKSSEQVVIGSKGMNPKFAKVVQTLADAFGIKEKYVLTNNLEDFHSLQGDISLDGHANRVIGTEAQNAAGFFRIPKDGGPLHIYLNPKYTSGFKAVPVLLHEFAHTVQFQLFDKLPAESRSAVIDAFNQFVTQKNRGSAVEKASSLGRQILMPEHELGGRSANRSRMFAEFFADGLTKALEQNSELYSKVKGEFSLFSRAIDTIYKIAYKEGMTPEGFEAFTKFTQEYMKDNPADWMKIVEGGDGGVALAMGKIFNPDLVGASKAMREYAHRVLGDVSFAPEMNEVVSQLLGQKKYTEYEGIANAARLSGMSAEAAAEHALAKVLDKSEGAVAGKYLEETSEGTRYQLEDGSKYTMISDPDGGTLIKSDTPLTTPKAAEEFAKNFPPRYKVVYKAVKYLTIDGESLRYYMDMAGGPNEQIGLKAIQKYLTEHSEDKSIVQDMMIDYSKIKELQVKLNKLHLNEAMWDDSEVYKSRAQIQDEIEWREKQFHKDYEVGADTNRYVLKSHDGYDLESIKADIETALDIDGFDFAEKSAISGREREIFRLEYDPKFDGKRTQATIDNSPAYRKFTKDLQRGVVSDLDMTIRFFRDAYSALEDNQPLKVGGQEVTYQMLKDMARSILKNQESIQQFLNDTQGNAKQYQPFLNQIRDIQGQLIDETAGIKVLAKSIKDFNSKNISDKPWERAIQDKAILNEAMQRFKVTRDMKAFKQRMLSKFRDAWVDPTGEAKLKWMREGEEGYMIARFADLRNGGGGRAMERWHQIEGEIYGGLSTKEKVALDNWIYCKRMTVLAKEHPDFITRHFNAFKMEDAQKMIDRWAEGNDWLSSEQRARIVERGNLVFTETQRILEDLTKAGLVKEEFLNRYKNIAYFPREVLLEGLDPVTGLHDVARTSSVTLGESGLEYLATGQEHATYNLKSSMLLKDYLVRSENRMVQNEFLNRVAEFNKDGIEQISFPKDPNISSYTAKSKGEIVYSFKEGAASKAQLDALRHDGYIFTDFMKDGQHYKLAIYKDFAGVIVNPTGATSSGFARFLQISSGSTFLRATATGMNMGFAITNFFRDLQHIWLTGNFVEGWEGKKPVYGSMYDTRAPWAGVEMIADFKDTIKDVLNHGPKVTEFAEHYGETSYMTQTFGDNKYIRAITKDSHSRIFGPLLKVLDGLQAFSNVSEIASRMMLKERALKKIAVREGLTVDGIRAMKESSPEQYRNYMLEATHYAREYMDFSLGGRYAKAVNNAIPFFNAGIQGTRGIGRTWTRNPKIAAAKIGQIMGFAALLYNYNTVAGADVWYSIEDEEKKKNWIIVNPAYLIGVDSNKYFKVPKDPAQAAMASISDMMSSWMHGDNQLSPKYVTKAFGDSLVPLGLPPTLNSFFIQMLDTEVASAYTRKLYPDQKLKAHARALFTSNNPLFNGIIGLSAVAADKELPPNLKDGITNRFMGEVKGNAGKMGTLEKSQEWYNENQQSVLRDIREVMKQSELAVSADHRLDARREFKKMLKTLEKNNPGSADAILDEYEFLKEFKREENLNWWMGLKRMPLDARAKAFAESLKEASNTKQRTMMKTAKKMFDNDEFWDKMKYWQRTQ